MTDRNRIIANNINSSREYKQDTLVMFRTYETHFIFSEKCAHYNTFYSVNALYIFPG